MDCLSDSRPFSFHSLTLLLVGAIVLASAKSASADDIMVTQDWRFRIAMPPHITGVDLTLR